MTMIEVPFCLFVTCNGIEQLALDPIANWLFLRSGFEELKVSISYSSSRVRTRRFLPLIRGEYDVETVVPMPIAVPIRELAWDNIHGPYLRTKFGP